MYLIYFNKILFPVAPKKIQMKVKGNNKTIDMINESEVNRIKGVKLTDISMDLLLPGNKYPFAEYKDGEFKTPSYFLEQLEQFKKLSKPFTFKILRNNPKGKLLFDTTLDMTLESYTIKEDADEGFDITVTVELKEYRDYGVKLLIPKTPDTAVVQTTPATEPVSKKTEEEPKAQTYTIVSGDTLWAISKKYYGDGSKYPIIYDANKSTIEAAASSHGKSGSGNGHWIYPGTTLTIPKG